MRLNGIISQHEFQESINQINLNISYKKTAKILIIVFAFGLIVGPICFIIEKLKPINFHLYMFRISRDIGLVLIIFVFIISVFGCMLLHSRRNNRMRKAIAEESKKYSSRLPIPCIVGD